MSKNIRGLLVVHIIRDTNADRIDWHSHVEGEFTAHHGPWIFRLEYGDNVEIKLAVIGPGFSEAGERIVIHPAVELLRKAVFDQYERKIEKFSGINRATKVKSSRIGRFEREKLNSDLRMVLKYLKRREV